jgi:hypothetical protein
MCKGTPFTQRDIYKLNETSHAMKISSDNTKVLASEGKDTR